MAIVYKIKKYFVKRKKKQLDILTEGAQKESIRAFVIDFKDGHAIIRFRGVMVFSNDENSVVVDTLRTLRNQYIADCVKEKEIL